MSYAELHCLTNFSFLEAASSPDELVRRAVELGYRSLAITDINTLGGIVRANTATKELSEQHREYEKLRKSIRDRWEEHASIESGALDLVVSEREHRSFSFAKLVEIGGQEWAANVRDRIATTRMISLKVVEW